MRWSSTPVTPGTERRPFSRDENAADPARVKAALDIPNRRFGSDRDDVRGHHIGGSRHAPVLAGSSQRAIRPGVALGHESGAPGQRWQIYRGS